MSDALRPRGVKLSEAARYVGLKPSSYRAAVARGVFPGPLPGTILYDIRAIDKAMDRLSGIEGRVPAKQDELSPYERWRAGRGDQS